MRQFIAEHGTEAAQLKEWVMINEPSVQNGTRPLESFIRPMENIGYHRAWKDAGTAVREDEAHAAEAQQAGIAGRVAKMEALVHGMGYGEDNAALALDSTGGGLQDAIDWLCGEHQSQSGEFIHVDSELEFPLEWVETLQDLVQMGFESTAAKAALKQHGGRMKQTIKDLVAAERAAPTWQQGQ